MYKMPYNDKLVTSPLRSLGYRTGTGDALKQRDVFILLFHITTIIIILMSINMDPENQLVVWPPLQAAAFTFNDDKMYLSSMLNNRTDFTDYLLFIGFPCSTVLLLFQFSSVFSFSLQLFFYSCLSHYWFVSC